MFVVKFYFILLPLPNFKRCLFVCLFVVLTRRCRVGRSIDKAVIMNWSWCCVCHVMWCGGDTDRVIYNLSLFFNFFVFCFSFLSLLLFGWVEITSNNSEWTTSSITIIAFKFNLKLPTLKFSKNCCCCYTWGKLKTNKQKVITWINWEIFQTSCTNLECHWTKIVMVLF